MILGKTGRAILEALLAGQDDPAVLAELAKVRLRPKIRALRQALTHRFRGGHHGSLGRCLPISTFSMPQCGDLSVG